MRTVFSQNNFSGGIQSYPKFSTIKFGYYFGRCVNYRDDPQAITLLPGAVKESGSVVTDLLKWGDLLPSTTDSYFYGDSGNLYHRNSSASWSNIHTAPNSHGNGLAYFFADDYLYYPSDSVIGRYGPVTGSSPTFVDDFLSAQGGIPTNTASWVVASASSQYATAADSASLSITSDITLEAFFKATTLPTTGNSMTLIGKWDESGALRSYKMDLYGVSGYFGDGSDGALTISSNTTESPIDSACTGTATTQSLSATNASFAQGQVILIHQTQGTNAGQWERNTIQGYTAGTITLGTPLIGTYVTGAQVRVLKQYTNVTINSGITYTAKAWNGTVGGILSFLANGTVTVTGSIVADACGFRGGAAADTSGNAWQGEGTGGAGTQLTTANGNGAGGGSGRAGGGSGGNATTGQAGTAGSSPPGTPGAAGNVAGSTDLTTMVFGGAGGGGGNSAGVTGRSGAGGNGGGIIFISGVTITVTGTITSAGQNGGNNTGSDGSGGGAGAAGSILLKAQTATLGTTLITSLGATTGGTKDSGGGVGAGNASNGRIALDYLTSFTGTTTPTLNAVQDNTLVTTTTIQARLGISNDGTAFEYLTQNLNTITTGVWNRLSISWVASTSVATFYLNAVSLGTSTGTKTAINDNISLLYLAANKGASTVGNFFNGKIDDVRIWNVAQSATTIYANNLIQVPVNAPGLQAYYTLNSVYTDSTSNANTLTAVNSPTFDTADVPFPAPTTRLDIDQSYTTTGSTYTLPTAISEATTDTLPFTPTNDPQKSVAFNVDTKGTGNWTVTVHDQQNRVIATQTITNANVLASGYMEFTFATPWRIVIGKTYHMHLTVSTGTSKVVSSSLNNFATADFYTYFAFLVTDTAFHPVLPFLNFLAIGNERYIAKWDGAFYTPNLIAFPTGWRVRALATWREFLAIGVWRGSSITSYTHGRVYFWDGIAPTFNFFIDVPDGQVNAMWGRDSDLFILAGYRGDLLDYQGSYFFDTGNSSSIKVRFLPKRSANNSIEVYPGAINYWRNLLHVGFGVNNSMTSVEQGVYAYGTYDPLLQSTVSYDYPISTGNRGTTVSIGLVYPIGDQLIIGWQDGIAFGADVIDFANNPASQGTLELMIQDDDAMWRLKTSSQLSADHKALASGESIDVGIKIDRAANYTTSPINSTVGSKVTNYPVSAGFGKEYQIMADLYATGSTSPTLLAVSLLRDDNKESEQFG